MQLEKMFRYNKWDKRYQLFRFYSRSSDLWMRREGWKLSASLHPRWFYFEKYFSSEFRLTILGINIHFRSHL
jgi:hypothetical protein